MLFLVEIELREIISFKDSLLKILRKGDLDIG